MSRAPPCRRRTRRRPRAARSPCRPGPGPCASARTRGSRRGAGRGSCPARAPAPGGDPCPRVRSPRRPRRRRSRRWLPPGAPEWTGAQLPSSRALVDGSPCGEPQACDVSLSDLCSSSSRSQRAYADLPGRGQRTPPPRTHRLCSGRAIQGRNPAEGRVAAHPAAGPVVVAPPPAPHLRPGSAGAVDLDALGLDADDHALFAGLAQRVLIDAHVLLGERVDVGVGALGGGDGGAAADLDVLVGVLEVLDVSVTRGSRSRFVGQTRPRAVLSTGAPSWTSTQTGARGSSRPLGVWRRCRSCWPSAVPRLGRRSSSLMFAAFPRGCELHHHDKGIPTRSTRGRRGAVLSCVPPRCSTPREGSGRAPAGGRC